MLEPSRTQDDYLSEDRRVIFRRFTEARDAGLTLVEARVFAESDADIGHLRKLVATQCPAALIAAILI